MGKFVSYFGFEEILEPKRQFITSLLQILIPLLKPKNFLRPKKKKNVPVQHFPPLVRKSAVQDFPVKFIVTNPIEQEHLSIEGTPHT